MAADPAPAASKTIAASVEAESEDASGLAAAAEVGRSNQRQLGVTRGR